MKKLLTITSLLILTTVNAQVHRFYYELTYRPNKDSGKTEKEMMVLDVAKDESVFVNYKQMVYDSIYISGVKKAREMGQVFLAPPTSSATTLSFRINKLKSGKQVFNDFVGMSEYYIYEEKPVLKWNIISAKEQIGNYSTQKATTEFGGRVWTAWFTSEIPIQDGPYKFSGLPGLIVKLEDSGKNYSWILAGNKKLDQDIKSNKQNYLEFQMGTPVKLSKEGFQKRLNEYERNPMSQMMQMFDEKDAELMKALKQQEVRIKEKIAYNNNPIEIN